MITMHVRYETANSNKTVEENVGFPGAYMRSTLSADKLIIGGDRRRVFGI
jgi:hypothetical protein